MKDDDQSEIFKVSTIELFFDLVFVFTVTQQTHLIEHAHGMIDLFRAFLVLTLVWYIYSGYTWLINNLGSQKNMRFILIGGMCGFLVMALSIPNLFLDSGLAFGLAFFWVSLLHLLAFIFGDNGKARSAMIKIWPLNFGTSIFVIAAAFVDAEYKIWLFFGATVWPLFTRHFINRSQNRFEFKLGHFIERHGLIVMIALGESVLGIGAGASSRYMDVRSICLAILAQLLVATIWWSYFEGGKEDGETALEMKSAAAKEVFAIRYWWAHLIIIGSIILIATALKAMLAEEKLALCSSFQLLTIGISVFFCGHIWIRLLLERKPVIARALGGLLILVWGLLGGALNPMYQLLSLLIFLVVLLFCEHKFLASA
ncbi:MAG: low temperature requirement protein A [Proteobacteria bacterium]|nr:low temperature requirement protein A [Pseudomonadota bacterium]